MSAQRKTAESSLLTSPADRKDNESKEFDLWLKNIYDPTFANDEFISNMKDAFEYKGFDQQKVLKQMFNVVKDREIVIQLTVLCALRGPQKAHKISLLNKRTASEMGIPVTAAKGTDNLSMNRIVAATADLAAYYLKKMKIPQRIKSELPAWLQFPSAGSIKMPKRFRDLHLEFSKRFSKDIGGEFNEQIYIQMENNAYLNDSLKLFDE